MSENAERIATLCQSERFFLAGTQALGRLPGEAEFCECFLDIVRVPTDNIIGKLNDGWSVGKTLLGF